MVHMHSIYIHIQRARLFITHAAYVHLHLSAYSCSHTCLVHTYTCMRYIHIRRTQLIHELTHQRTCSCAYARRFWSPHAPRLSYLHAAIIVSNDSETNTKYRCICSICIYLHMACIFHAHMCIPSATPLLRIAAGIHVFSCCIILVLTADRLLCTNIYAYSICLPIHATTASTQYTSYVHAM